MNYFKIIIISVMAVIILSVSIIAYNKTLGTEVGKSRANMSREIFKSSKPYIENMANTLNNYKMQYDLASEKDKLIIKNNIKSEFANFDAFQIGNANLRNFLINIQGE